MGETQTRVWPGMTLTSKEKKNKKKKTSKEKKKNGKSYTCFITTDLFLFGRMMMINLKQKLKGVREEKEEKQN